MYNFVDTIENISNTDRLPVEALAINGQYLEAVIPGYKTITVSGRESFDMKYDEKKIGNNLSIQDYYQDSRIIEVEYLLEAGSPEEFMEKYNTLNRHLNFAKAKISFADEPDKYFIGTKTESEIPPKGLLRVISTFQIYCPDPRKYSMTTKTFTAAKNNGIMEATIVNGGTASVPINYIIKHNHDNGYIGIASKEGVMQFGKTNEVDGVTYKGSEVLIDTFGFGGFSPDTGINAENTEKLTNGTLANMMIDGENCLGLNTSGSGSYMHGGMMSKEITPSKSFICNFRLWFEAVADQIGGMSLTFLDANGQMICSYIVEKTVKGSNIGRIIVRAGGNNPVSFLRADYNIYDGGLNFTSNSMSPELHGGMADIGKDGGTISAYFNGERKSVYVPELANRECKKIQLYIGQYGNDSMVSHAYFMWLAFQRNNVDKWRDIPNRYPNGSVVTISGEESKIHVNGIAKMADEIKGTQYFMAPPGESKVQFYYSDFSNPAPDITAEIREAWL